MKIKILGGALLAALLFSTVQTHSFSSDSEYCNTNAQCDYPTQQKCLNHECVCDPVKCTALGKACTTGIVTCVDCISDTQCKTSPLTHCLTTTNKCVQCLTSTQCPLTKPFCSGNACVQCRSNTDCKTSPKRKCDLTTKTCICDDSYCPAGPPRQYCSVLGPLGSCKQCRADRTANCDLSYQVCDSTFSCSCDSVKCQGIKGAGHGFCQAANNCATVQCLADGDCPTGSLCDTTTHTCGCDPTCADCTISAFCSVGTCTTLGSSTQCGGNNVCVDTDGHGALNCQPNDIVCRAADGTQAIGCPTGMMCLSDSVFYNDPVLQYANVCTPVVTSPLDCLNYICPDGYSNAGGATVTDGTNLFCSCSKPKV